VATLKILLDPESRSVSLPFVQRHFFSSGAVLEVLSSSLFVPVPHSWIPCTSSLRRKIMQRTATRNAQLSYWTIGHLSRCGGKYWETWLAWPLSLSHGSHKVCQITPASCFCGADVLSSRARCAVGRRCANSGEKGGAT